MVEHGNFGSNHGFRGHHGGAFGHRPTPHDAGGHGSAGAKAGARSGGRLRGGATSNPNLRGGPSNRELGHAAGQLGKSSPLGRMGKAAGQVGQKDPNLDDLGSGLGASQNLLNNSPDHNVPDNLRDGSNGSRGQGPNAGEDGPGLTNPQDNSGIKSGLPDPSKSQNPDPNLPGTKPSRNPLKKFGDAMPQQLQNLGKSIGGGYSKLTMGISSGVRKVGKKMKLSIGPRAALKITHGLMAGALGLGFVVGGYAYERRQVVLDGGDICNVQNTGSESYSGTTGESGTGGDWTQKGTKEYKRAKELWDYCVHLGFTGTQCAAFLGNAAHEGGGFHNLAQDQIGGGGGKGIFQFTPGSKYDNDPKSDHSWSIKNQVDVFMDLEKAAFSQWYHQTKNSHDVSDCTNVFEKLIERGGIPDFSRRDSMAEQAYSMFHGSRVKGNPSKIEKILGGGDQAAANSNAATAEKANNAECEGKGGDDSGDTSDIVHTAKLLEGYFTYANSRPVPPNVTKNHSSTVKAHDIASIDKHGTTDCSGYVWLVVQLSGYHPSWYAQTHAMESAAKSNKGLHEISASQTKPGDIAITDGSGDDHTVILLQHYHGTGTKIVNEGGSSNGPVHEETIGTAYGQYWNHYHFAHPTKE